MGKRKNKQKDEDRIVQRRRIKKEDPNKPPAPLQEEPEVEYESDSASVASEDLERLIEIEEQNQAEEKSKVQKFMEKFKIEGDGEAETQDHRKRLSKMTDKINLIEDGNSIQASYSQFFNFNKDTLIAEKLEEVAKERAEKKSDKEVLREKMKEIFNLNNDEGEEINPYKKHDAQKQRERELAKTIVDPVKAALNNNVELKEFALKKSLKDKKPFSVENVAEYVVDESAAQCIVAAGGLNKSTANLHESIPIPAPLTQAQQIEFAIMNNYHDLVTIDPEETNNETFRTMYATHIMNHLTKAPLRTEGGEEEDDDEAPQEGAKTNSKKSNLKDDQSDDAKFTGYTNCKAVIIAPFKGDAVGIVNELLRIYGEKKVKKNSRKQRFEVEYEDPERAEEDDFRIAISITNKGLKLFTPFATCDIIVTSLIGLRLATSAKDDTSSSAPAGKNANQKEKQNQQAKQQERDFSFLSSVEILVIDRAHALYMQNWQHMHVLMGLFNRVPKHKAVTNSIHRIREYFFENLSRFYRQTIVYAEFGFAELNSLKAKHMHNHRGCLTVRPFYAQLPHTKLNQEFVKFEVKDLQNEMDERLAFFKAKIWDDWNKEEMDRSVIFVSSYFEYLKLKSMFVKQNAPVFGICEYSKKRDVQKRISLFRNNTLPYLMQTERAYFFDVGSVRGMKNILFYSLPKNAFIYQEMISYLDQAAFKQSKCKVACLFNKYDALALERIVGTENAKELLATYNKATSFVL